MNDKDFKADIFAKTAAQWTAEDPFLARNDLGVEVDTGRTKMGVGQKWSATDYVPVPSVATVPDAPIMQRGYYDGIYDLHAEFLAPPDDGGSPILGYKAYALVPESAEDPVPNDASTFTERAGTFNMRPLNYSAEIRWTPAVLLTLFVAVSAYNAVGEGPRSRPVKLIYS